MAGSFLGQLGPDKHTAAPGLWQREADEGVGMSDHWAGRGLYSEDFSGAGCLLLSSFTGA